MIGSENLKNGFYSDKFEVIENAVRSYAEVKANSPKLEDLETIKQTTQTLLSRMMVESGLKNEESAFISLDNEFFDEGGVFSDTKLGDFQKMIVQYYALNDIKWTFAGTTSMLTRLSKKSMEDEGVDYAEMLPVEIKRKHNQEEIRKITGITPQATQVFIYPDNTISTQYVPKKAKVKFNSLEDKNTNLWKTDYDPNLKIEKKDWAAGFNSSNNWEYLSYNKTNFKSEKETKASVSFPEKEKTTVSLLQTPDLIETIFMDPSNLLKDGEEERFYSISGELYGERILDKESTIDEIKNTFKKTGIEKLTGVVVKDNEEDTISYYQKNFNEYLDADTKFYNANDEELTAKVMEIKKYIKENDISSGLIDNYFDLVKKGKSPDEIYDNLINSTVKGEIEESLQIFSNKTDMETFIKMPEISEDEELKEALLKMKVPEEQSVKLSNSVQNIVKNYDSKFKNTGFDKKELSESAYRLIAKKEKDENITKINVRKEKILGDFIEDNILRDDNKSDIPSFKKNFKKEKDYFNIYDENERQKWNDGLVKNKVLNKEISNKLNEFLRGMKIPPDKKEDFSNSLQNTFDEFKTIQQNTGLKPEELATAIYNKITGAEDPRLNKKIVFEKNLTDLLNESSLDNPYKMTHINEDFFYKPVYADAESGGLNLLKNTDIDVFALQSLKDFMWENEDDKNTTVSILKNARIPSGSGKDFTFGVNQIIKKHKNKKSGTTLLNDLKLFTSSVNEEIKDLPSDIKKLSDNLKRNRFTNNKNINLFDNEDFENFLSNNNLNKEEFALLLEQFKKKYEQTKADLTEEMPLVYNDKLSGNKSVLNAGIIEENAKANTFMNLGWKIKLTKDKKTIVDFTGNKDQDEISSIFISSFSAAENMSDSDDEESQKVFLNLGAIANETTGGLNQTQYVYANPYVGLIKKKQQIMNKLQGNPQKTVTENLLKENEDPQMKKVNENYIKDKQALARSKSVTNDTSTSTGNDNSKQNDNKIIQSADEFINAIKKEIDRSF